MGLSVPGYQIEQSLEPKHPRCTTSDPVFAARDARGNRVALKVLSLGFPLRPESEAKYLEAIGRARAIASPHVVPILDAGFTDGGAPYYAMEYAPGEVLARVIERGLVATAEQTRTILGQLAAAATAVTAAGCKATLSTRHILLSPHGARAWDFGVWPWRSWAHDLVFGTYVGVGQVTWHPNITPTEATGVPSPTNVVAQLALIAFSMLTARHYWNADNDPGASPMNVLVEVMAGPGAPPSTRTPVALPPGFDAWFVRCLAGEYTDAHAAAAAF